MFRVLFYVVLILFKLDSIFFLSHFIFNTKDTDWEVNINGGSISVLKFSEEDCFGKEAEFDAKYQIFNFYYFILLEAFAVIIWSAGISASRGFLRGGCCLCHSRHQEIGASYLCFAFINKF